MITSHSAVNSNSAAARSAVSKDPLEESLAAIRDAITSRDRHFDALTEQLRQGFQAVQRQTEEDRAAVQGQIEALGAQLEGIERKVTPPMPCSCGNEISAIIYGSLDGKILPGTGRGWCAMCLAKMGYKNPAKVGNTLIPVRLETSDLPAKRPAGRKKAKR